MKREFLETLGLDKETVTKVMAEHGKTIEQQKGLTTAAEKDRDNYKGQLDTVTAQLKTFDGVDVAKLKDNIQTLQGDLATQQSKYAAELADRDFTDLINAEITVAKGKNPKAIMALLGIDDLKASKNQKEDAAAAIKALRESDGYLFDDPKRQTRVLSTGGTHREDGVSGAGKTLQELMAEANADPSQIEGILAQVNNMTTKKKKDDPHDRKTCRQWC